MAKKILLADDSLTIQKVVELTFSDGDYDLVCVSNGQKALDKVRDDRPDLILADVVMPEKNGYEVCEAIKGNPATARIPVVLLSGTFEPFDRDRAERIGCDAIVSKPFDSQQLISQVEALLGRARAEMPEAEIPERNQPAASQDSERGPFDAGFSSEDFTASIRISPNPERFDPFEEEYGRGDADTAILAFEKAHPEFSGSAGEASESEGSLRGDSPADAPWLIEEPEPAAPSTSSAAASRGGIWAPVEDEESDRPLDFDAERTGSFRPGRADEGPTQEIPQEMFRAERGSARYPSEPGLGAATALPNDSSGGRSRLWDTTPEPEEISADDAEVLFDVASSEDGDETEEISSMPAFSAGQPERSGELLTAGGLATPSNSDGAGPDGEPEGDDGPPADARELEALAQTASIPELTTMLSSVMRSGGELSDAEIDRLAQRVVEKLSDRIVREIAWEVIPDMAEIVIKERIKELESGVE
ncbi:MAG: response regulator [Thermoanaerobaculia bacterium]|nr:response regulator [Thermoanaerobaculia bacterium]